DRNTWERLLQFRQDRPHMLSRAVVVTTVGNFRVLAALANDTTLCFSSPVEMSRTPVIRPTWWSMRTRAAFSDVSGSYGRVGSRITFSCRNERGGYGCGQVRNFMLSTNAP